MPDVPTNADKSSDDASQQPLQGYQDDFDTSKRDEFANNEGENHPLELVPDDRTHLSEGLRQTATEDETNDADPDVRDDLMNEIESRDEDGYQQQT